MSDKLNKDTENKDDDKGVFSIGEDVIHDGEAETLGVDPMVWVPPPKEDKDA